MDPEPRFPCRPLTEGAGIISAKTMSRAILLRHHTPRSLALSSRSCTGSRGEGWAGQAGKLNVGSIGSTASA